MNKLSNWQLDPINNKYKIQAKWQSSQKTAEQRNSLSTLQKVQETFFSRLTVNSDWCFSHEVRDFVKTSNKDILEEVFMPAMGNF